MDRALSRPATRASAPRARAPTPDRRASGRRPGWGRLVERRPIDLARLEDLEHVTLAQVVEALEQDPALEALGHLARVVLEALQLRDGRLVDARPVAEDAHVRAAAHQAARDHAAGDRAEARHLE